MLTLCLIKTKNTETSTNANPSVKKVNLHKTQWNTYRHLLQLSERASRCVRLTYIYMYVTCCFVMMDRSEVEFIITQAFLF